MNEAQQPTAPWHPDPWTRSWRSELATANEAVQRLLPKIRQDMLSGAYTEGLHFVVPACNGFRIVSMLDDNLYGCRSGTHLELRRKTARVLADAACAVEIQQLHPSVVLVAVEWPDFSVEILGARRRPDGLGDFEVREARRPMEASDYPMLHPNYKVSLSRGWCR